MKGVAGLDAPPVPPPLPAAARLPVGTACDATVLAVLAPPTGVAAPEVGIRSGRGRASARRSRYSAAAALAPPGDANASRRPDRVRCAACLGTSGDESMPLAVSESSEARSRKSKSESNESETAAGFAEEAWAGWREGVGSCGRALGGVGMREAGGVELPASRCGFCCWWPAVGVPHAALEGPGGCASCRGLTHRDSKAVRACDSKRPQYHMRTQYQWPGSERYS